MPELSMPNPSPRKPSKPPKGSLPAGAKDVTEKYAHVLAGAQTPAGAGQGRETAQPGGAPHGSGVTNPTPALSIPKPVPPPAPPMMNLNALVSATEAMAGAVNNTYLGNFTEGDAKGNVSRSLQVTQWQDIMMNEIAQDSRFGYNGSKSQLMRHAIELLINYYQEKGMIAEERRGLFADLLRAGRMLREDAERARIRADFTDNIRTHDRTMDMARLTGDWQAIAHRLERYTDAVETCEDEAQRKILRGVFGESVATRTAVTAFNRWINDPGRASNEHVTGWKDSWPVLAEQWREFYNEWGSV